MSAIGVIREEKSFRTTDDMSFTVYQDAIQHQREVDFHHFYNNGNQILSSCSKREVLAAGLTEWLKTNRKYILTLYGIDERDI